MESSGIDLTQFVHPSHVSKNLLCPITQSVLEKPVMTPCEHLFCEDALLEWLLRSDRCPVCNNLLNPEEISKPGRVIVNMLAELKRFCPHRSRGCLWTGPNEQVEKHLSSKCSHKDDLDNVEHLKDLVEQLKVENHKIKEVREGEERRTGGAKDGRSEAMAVSQ